MAPHDVTTVLYYFDDDKPGRPTKPQETVIHDIRGNESQYTLDTTGFQIFKHSSKEKDFLDDEQIKRSYYPEMEELLKNITGASKVFVYDHTIRGPSKSCIDPNGSGKPPSHRRPIHWVHVDTSYIAGPKLVSRELPSEAHTLLKGRYQVINVWRPIRTILKDPLAVADANSVPDSDLVPAKLNYSDSGGRNREHKPDEKGKVFSVRASTEHKWYYPYKQSPEEVLLIKCFDSKMDGRARRAPHTAFVNSEHEDMPRRESIEVRTLVFHPDDIERAE
ncbi:hypothetical protein F4777DRAFT_579152 [Nemania sp. FL0916]|nr:hypothetical protein F4777DRAFT_579152 [Nemania sp. FL0916]